MQAHKNSCSIICYMYIWMQYVNRNPSLCIWKYLCPIKLLIWAGQNNHVCFIYLVCFFQLYVTWVTIKSAMINLSHCYSCTRYSIYSGVYISWQNILHFCPKWNRSDGLGFLDTKRMGNSIMTHVAFSETFWTINCT